MLKKLKILGVLLICFNVPSLFADGVVIRTANKIILEGVSLHKQNYFLPLTYRVDQGGSDKSELIFQFSAKMQVVIPNFYIAYTQTSYWQFLDSNNSSPFRETNYNPEILYHITPETLGGDNWGAYVGVEHESNGKSLPNSRSWDRAYLWPYWNSGHGEYSLKLWLRRSEDDKTSAEDTRGDDNPDIHQYMGYGELYFYHFKSKGRSFSGMLRGNPATGKGAVQLGYSWPLSQIDTYFFARFFSGYGESLIDYNESVHRISFGFEFR